MKMIGIRNDLAFSCLKNGGNSKRPSLFGTCVDSVKQAALIFEHVVLAQSRLAPRRNEPTNEKIRRSKLRQIVSKHLSDSFAL